MPNILIVDDASYIRKKITNDLSGSEFKIIGEATNGVEAITMYKQKKPDLILMDVVMPGKGGVEATYEIMTNDPGAKIVLLSSLDNEIVVIKALEAGARDFINKPFEKEQLLKHLRDLF